MKLNPMCGFVFAIFILLAIPAQAEEIPRPTIGGGAIHGGNPQFAKAGADTINLMSTHGDPSNGPGEPYYFGDFEDADGNPCWNGWTHRDLTQPTETHWNVSTYNQGGVVGDYAAWAGDITIPVCTTDAVGGYGNSWTDLLRFSVPVGNSGVSSMVTVTASLQYDSEPGYDYTYLSYKFFGMGPAWGDMQSWDRTSGDFDDVPANEVAVTGSVTYLPSEYIAGNQIAIYWRFQSDGAWSDEDCLFAGHGGCQVDDINVKIVNDGVEVNFFENFDGYGGDPDNFGVWNVAFPEGVGDFAHIWTGLHDIDPCINNYSPQVAFIDDGIVVPGTGGSRCVNWCYGPGGYIVTTTGGLAGPGEHINNVIESPVMAWPDPQSGSGPDDDGIILDFGLYHHEDLADDAPGIFYNWRVRSADTDGSAGNGVQDIDDQLFFDREFVNLRPTGYTRTGDDVTDMMNPGRDEVQVQLAVEELGYIWGYTGDDGYPAPWFDNVIVKVFPYIGPGMTTWEVYLAQDNFPERGAIDFGDLGSHHIRFDMAKDISPSYHLRNDPGDSILVIIRPVRAGADFDGDPELHYFLDRNPVFDPYRSAGLPDQGFVTGAGSSWWAFDLPDTGFLFPGDVLHYYISATDAIGGVGGTDPQTSLMPADTTGFSTGFGDPMGYNSSFVVRGLPSIRDDGSGGYEHPSILFINEFDTRFGGENIWYSALNNLALLAGEDYDVYYVNMPSSGAGNGIGGRASGLTLAGYDDILYTCGNLGKNTISNGDFQNDAGDDVGTLTYWLDLGGKDIFLTGNGLASDLAQSGTVTLDFLESYMGVAVATTDVRPFIGNQTTPLVKTVSVADPNDEVFTGILQTWIAYGGCFGLNNFDGVRTMGSAVRLAELTDPEGQAGAYDFSAATLNRVGTSRIISMPVDLMFIYTDPAAAGNPFPGRVQLLSDVLLYFGIVGEGEATGTEEVPRIAFTTTHYPNPFNPVTTIKYSLPKAGHLQLSIYNIRGQLVKTLINALRPAGADQTAVWDGTDNQGSAVASGVYFYDARAAGEQLIGKMTLIK